MSFFHCTIRQQSLWLPFHRCFFNKMYFLLLTGFLGNFLLFCVGTFLILFLNVYAVCLYLSLAVSPKSFIPRAFFFQLRSAKSLCFSQWALFTLLFFGGIWTCPLNCSYLRFCQAPLNFFSP